jgi:hypothetical protein
MSRAVALDVLRPGVGQRSSIGASWGGANTLRAAEAAAIIERDVRLLKGTL